MPVLSLVVLACMPTCVLSCVAACYVVAFVNYQNKISIIIIIITIINTTEIALNTAQSAYIIYIHTYIIRLLNC